MNTVMNGSCSCCPRFCFFLKQSRTDHCCCIAPAKLRHLRKFSERRNLGYGNIRSASTEGEFSKNMACPLPHPPCVSPTDLNLSLFQTPNLCCSAVAEVGFQANCSCCSACVTEEVLSPGKMRRKHSLLPDASHYYLCIIIAKCVFFSTSVSCTAILLAHETMENATGTTAVCLPHHHHHHQSLSNLASNRALFSADANRYR